MCENEADYRLRWPRAAKRFFTAASPRTAQPLIIHDRAGLLELSFTFFVGWLFTSILNQSKTRFSLGLVPVGPNRETSILVLFRRTTHLAAPARQIDELLDPDYFACPLDRCGGRSLSDTEKHLCPVVNKLRYNLSHARPDGNVSDLREPSKTAQCCASGKSLLWSYLADTVCTNPDLYGPMVGGAAFPINLPYDFLSDYLTGTPPRTDDFGKLMEETLLWFAMGASGVLIGQPHATVGVPVDSFEIDLLLYESPVGKHAPQRAEPIGGWSQYLKDQSLCLIELTVGHQADTTKGEPSDEDTPERSGYTGAGMDKPKNKILNFSALKSYGFHLVRSHYITAIGSQMNGVMQRAVNCTDGFSYACLADYVRDDIGGAVLAHDEQQRVGNARARAWHAGLVEMVETAARSFRHAIRPESAPS